MITHQARRFTITMLACLAGHPPLLAAGVPHEEPNFDARVAHNRSFEAAPTPTQRAAADQLRNAVPELLVSYDPTTGATRSVLNATGSLTAPAAGEPVEVALGFARANLGLLGLSEADFAGYEVTDRVFSRVSDSTHLYLRQVYRGIPVYNGQLQVNVGRGGRLMSVNNAFVPGLASAVNVRAPMLSAAAAVERAAADLGLWLDRAPVALGSASGPRQVTPVSPEGVSLDPIEARLFWLPVRAGDVRLVWSFDIRTLDQLHHYDFNVDAVSGAVWTRTDRVLNASYKVYPRPVESPAHTTPAPPADARLTVVNPADTSASPYGWHDNGFGANYTTHRGNNVHSFHDTDGDGDPSPGDDVDCGSNINCVFPINLTEQPSTYTAASVTNAFYWANIAHDIQYRYGFDEEAGNYQAFNYNKPGEEGDHVRVLVQSAFGCPDGVSWHATEDGDSPFMRLCHWTPATPDRDSALEGVAIIHEYGHGVSKRLVGGPNNDLSCLTNLQQPGEGLSDWLALVYTATAAQTGPTPRGIATYITNNPAGLRTQLYSTNPAVNTFTYESLADIDAEFSHRVGEVWAQAAWEVYWALVDEHGFSKQLKQANGGYGNQRAMMYFNEGLKNTPCSPTFVDVRNGVLNAANEHYGGEDKCIIWNAFAAFGLGLDADPAGPNSLDVTNGYSVPAQCQ